MISPKFEEILNNLTWKKDENSWHGKYFFPNGDRIWIIIENNKMYHRHLKKEWDCVVYIDHGGGTYSTEILNEGHKDEKIIKTFNFDTPEECWEYSKQELLSLDKFFCTVWTNWLYGVEIRELDNGRSEGSKNDL